MVSIIIPVYNSSNYIERCVESIIRQSYTDWEALLINDGSTDDSGAICDKWAEKDRRVRVFHQRNRGVSCARNVGLENALGEWVTFADSDDYLEPTAFETYMYSVEKYDADVVKAGYYREYADGHTVTIALTDDEEYTDTCPFFCRLERQGYYSFLWTLFIRRKCVGDIRFNERLTWLEDHTFAYSTYLNCHKMVILGVPLYHYIVHQKGSLSDIRDPYVVKEAGEIERHLKMLLIHGADHYMQDAVENLYRFRLTTIVSLLYTEIYTWKERGWFAKNCNLIPNLKYKEEKIFFAAWMPFFMRDTILRCLFWIKKRK